MFRSASMAAAVFMLAATPTIAQRAVPVTQGSTTSDLATSTARLQITTADLKLKVDDLQAENARLNGKIETLEFLLSQSRDEINRMQGDDQEIGRQLSDLGRRLDNQNAKIASLEAEAAQVIISSATAGGTEAAQADTVVTTGTTRIITQPTETTNGNGSGPRQLTAATRSTDNGSNPPQTGSLGTIPASALPGEAGPLFAEAKSKLIQFDYPAAEQAFRAFLDKFGDDPQAGEAHYWLGEALYQQQALADSGAVFTAMITTYPDDVRAPDALVKLARSLRGIGETEKACAALNALPNRYPNASQVTLSLAAVERSRSDCDS